MSVVTNLRIEYLASLKRVCKGNITGLAEPKEIAKDLGDIDKNKVRAMLYRLLDIGWVERPKSPFFRLTKEGERVLEQNTAR